MHKLFCLPYAGSSCNIYYPWKSKFPSSIEIVPIELAGRGKRFDEPQYKEFNQAVKDVFDIITSEINISDEYSIFGHSMGGLIAYEVLHLIEHNDIASPKNSFLSGCIPPKHLRKKDKLHTLSDAEFNKAVKSLGGTESLFFKSDLFNVFIEIIRADLKLIETHEFTGISCSYFNYKFCLYAI